MTNGSRLPAVVPSVLVVALAGLLMGCSVLVREPEASAAGYGPGTWALDPAFPEPSAQSTELHILVWERACNGGRLINGRMAPPFIETTETIVMVTMLVQPLGGIQTCPGGPGTPLLVELPQPLGNRTLMDGGREPPSEPSPPY